MELQYSVVKHPHLHTVEGRLARTASDTFYWDKSKQLSDYAVLAHSSEAYLVGIQKFDINRADGEVKLSSIATYVWPLYRQEGAAVGMWSTALRELEVTAVHAQVVSDRGKTLIETLKVKFPGVRFTVSDLGARRLRSLKGKGKRNGKAAI